MTSPHHWAQGPMDVRVIQPVDIPGTDRVAFWVFNYWIENVLAVAGIVPKVLGERVDWVLNQAPLAWSRTGVLFHRVHRVEDAQIVLRFSDDPPVGWPELAWGPGWYYHDAKLGKNVAQVTAKPEYFNDPPSLAYYVGMELAGHGCFRMWDMYIPEHSPYPVGGMGDFAAAMVNGGYPSEAEIAAAKLWLGGEAATVDSHPQFTVPLGVEHGRE